MLQVALAGYNISPVAYISATLDDTLTYREPGYTEAVGENLTIDVNQSDQIYLTIRKRGATAGTYTTIVPADLKITTTDVTNGQTVPSFITTNQSGGSFYHAAWNNDSSLYDPLVAVITNCFNYYNPISKIRAMDVVIKEINGGTDFIRFRLHVNDSDKLLFNYLIIDANDMNSRNTFTMASREALINVGNANDLYVLFSPYAFLKEIEEAKSDFSYPLNSVFYQRQKSFNDEGFEFSIGAISHPWILDNITIMNVPKYDKAAVVLIDKHIYNELAIATSPVSVLFKVYSKTSEMVDYFKVYFSL